VYGNVKGNLRAKDRIEIKKDGSVNGDLTIPHHDRRRRYFKGSIEIDKTPERNPAGMRLPQLRTRGRSGNQAI